MKNMYLYVEKDTDLYNANKGLCFRTVSTNKSQMSRHNGLSPIRPRPFFRPEICDLFDKVLNLVLYYYNINTKLY